MRAALKRGGGTWLPRGEKPSDAWVATGRSSQHPQQQPAAALAAWIDLRDTAAHPASADRSARCGHYVPADVAAYRPCSSKAWAS